MSARTPEEFTQLLYSRMPAHYRARDAERNLPLLALLRVVGTQASNIRQNLDDLWDNFFIETCDDWVVPYLGKLLGTKLLAHPVGQSDRLDVWNTVGWRRSKGTPRMLQELSTAITEWPTDLAEFFHQVGWSQNLNHLRPGALLMPDLRDPFVLSLLGRASDSLLHAADFKPAYALDQSRSTVASLSIGKYAWGTPGRYEIKNIGFFVRRLQAFPVSGVQPAAVDPGAALDLNAACFTFDPLHREVPLFTAETTAPISRAAFQNAPWDYFDGDIAVRQHGVPLAITLKPQVAYSNSSVAFTFGFSSSGVTLDSLDGIRLVETRGFASGGAAFILTAKWLQDDGTIVDLGSLNTWEASLNLSTAFSAGSTTTDTGVLSMTIELAGPGTAPWTTPPFTGLLPTRFPGAIVSLRRGQSGPLRSSDALYVYLPSAYITPGVALTVWVADDGSTYFNPSFDVLSSAREAEGQVYPQWSGTPSAVPALGFTALNRGKNGLVIADPSRFGALGAVFVAELYTGVPQMLGGIATVDVPGVDFPLLNVPTTWPAFSFGADPNAVTGSDVHGILDILVQPVAAGSPPTTGNVPPTELIFTNREGESLLIYLPEIVSIPAQGVRFFVADDGSTYYFPANPSDQHNALNEESLAGLVLGRAASAQAVPIPGVWPLMQRRPVAINLCRCERTALLHNGELGIDPELGRFGFAPGDSAIGSVALTVDYVEALSDRVGAVNFDRQIDPSQLATRLVSSSGDADASTAVPNAKIYTTLSAAVADAQDGDIIEITDSATYAESTSLVLSDPTVENLTIRARNMKRPCITSYAAQGTPTGASISVVQGMQQLQLNGLLLSGGPVMLQSAVQNLMIVACTIDPGAVDTPAVISYAPGTATAASYLFCRCITGGLRFATPGLMLTIADSIVDAGQGIALAGASPLVSPPIELVPTAADATVQLERVTVLGRIFCDVLSASECILNDYAFVEDQQSGCIRFTRYERGSVLPRRYRCVPTEDEISSLPLRLRAVPPMFNSRRFGRPAYMQLAAACPAEILTASEAGAEVGAFASRLNTIRLDNLAVKLQEFLPVGLTPIIIAET